MKKICILHIQCRGRTKFNAKIEGNLLQLMPFSLSLSLFYLAFESKVIKKMEMFIGLGMHVYTAKVVWRLRGIFSPLWFKRMDNLIEAAYIIFLFENLS